MARYTPEELAALIAKNQRDKTGVTNKQLRQAIRQQYNYGQFKAYLAQNDAREIDWDFAAQIKRGDTLVDDLKDVFNITDADVDNLFDLAATL